MDTFTLLFCAFAGDLATGVWLTTWEAGRVARLRRDAARRALPVLVPAVPQRDGGADAPPLPAVLAGVSPDGAWLIIPRLEEVRREHA